MGCVGAKAGQILMRFAMIDRRHFLTTSAATMAAPGMAKAALSKGLPDVAVVGAGVFGAFAALSLREAGMSVISLDQYGPVSPRASSSGETRSIRSGYGDQAFYSAWSAKALAKWRMREAEYGRKLLYPSARIELAREWLPGMVAQRKIFDGPKLPYEVANREELRRRFPQMAFDDVEFAFVETAASSVLVKAREAVLATIEAFEKRVVNRVLPAPCRGGQRRALANLEARWGRACRRGLCLCRGAVGWKAVSKLLARASMSGAASIFITARLRVIRAIAGRISRCGTITFAADGALAASSGG
jgi:glycine/D-amino acid oxidase-like deaminating enzyme